MLSDAEAPVQGRSTGTSRASPTSPGELKTLGKYVIERKLGAGGMGTVYLGRDTAMRRAVALKVLPKDKAENPILVRRFKAEAQAAAALKHENIVAVYDSDSADGYLYIAMEFIDGIDLHELVNKRGPLPVKRSIEIIKQIASALQHAHERQIVHRDIKPSNLLIRRDGVVKITDLGLARSVDDTIETGITRAGTTVGTVDYMAPEQAKSSKAADIRSDIYSLGCTWYHMLTGGPPFPEGSLTNKLQAHATKPLPDPRTVNDQVTEALVAVLNRMTAKKPEDRYQTPAELLKDLESSTLTKAAFSKEILDAIDEDSSVPTPAARPSKAHGAGVMPPPTRKRLPDGSEEKPGINFEFVKLGMAIALVVGAVVGLAYLVYTYGGLLAGPAPTISPHLEPFANQTPQQNPVDVAPVGGGGNLTPMATNTEVAPVFAAGGTTAIQPGASASPTQFGPGAAASGTVTPAATSPLTPGSAATGTPSGVGAATLGTGSTGRASEPPFDPLKVPEWATAAGSATTGTAPTGPGVPGTARPGTTGAKAGGPGALIVPGLSALTVGPGVGSATHYHTLAEALAHVSGEGAVVQLVGNGPFVVNSNISVAAKRIVISAANDAEPLVVFAGREDSVFSSLGCSGGTLELKGIHFSADFPANQPATLLAVRDGSLMMSGCSFTVTGNDAAAVTVISIDNGARVLLDQTLIRGDFHAAVELRSPSVEAVIRDSLIVAGNGTAVKLSSGSPPTGPRPMRSLKCAHSTLVSRGRIVDLSEDGSLAEPPTTYLSFINSNCCTAGPDGPRVLLDAEGWKQDTLREGVTWTSRDSVFLGFQSLVEFGGPPAQAVSKSDSWRLFWQQRVDPEQFRNDVWPAGIEKFAAITVDAFDSAALPEGAKKVSESGEPPGVAASKLKIPEAVAPERLGALAHRRWIPPALQEPSGDKFTSRVDLLKEDLGKVLARGDWPDGAVIVATGQGLCTMTPVQIGKRSLRLVFRQAADGPPLRLSPKDTTKDAEALFRVDQGTLVLEGLRWQGPDPRPNVPQWLVSASDANVVLRDCDLVGPDRVVPPYQGVVRIASESGGTSTPPALVVLSSFLHSPGTLVRVEAGAASVFVRNSLLVARGVAFDVRPRAVNGDLPLVLDLVHSTVAANQTAFQWAATSLPQPPRIPARVFVDGCVFGPPFSLRSGDAAHPTLFTYAGPAVLEQKQVEWWGLSNGVSSEVKYLVRPEGPPPAIDRAGPQAWDAAWGAGHEVRLLVRPGGVMLAEEQMPTRRDALRPKSYQLHPNSKAIVWAEGRPIGADLASLDQVGPQNAATATTKTAPTQKKTPGPTTKPVTKGPGF